MVFWGSIDIQFGLQIETYFNLRDRKKNELEGEKIIFDLKCTVDTTLEDNYDTKVVIRKESMYGYDYGEYILFDDKIEKINKKHYKISFLADEAKNQQYKIYYYIENTQYGLTDQYILSHSLTIRDVKTEAKVTGVKLNGILQDGGSSYTVRISPEFVNSPTPIVDIVGVYNGKSINKILTILKNDFDDRALLRIPITISLNESIKDVYIMNDYTTTINVKTLIDKALDDKANNIVDTSTIVPELIATSTRNIQVGESVTFSLDASNISDKIKSNFFGGVSSEKKNGKYIFNATYYKKGVFFPSVTVLLNNGITETIKSKTIFVSEVPESVDDNIAPIAKLLQEYTIFSNTPLDILLEVSDADNDPMTLVLKQYPSHGRLTGSGVVLTYTPNTDYVGEDSFTYSVKDDKGGVSNEATVTLTVKEVKPSEVKAVSYPREGNYADACSAYSSTGCEKSIQRGTSFVKQWAFTNTGNVALSGVKVVPITSSTDSALTISLKSPMARSLAINESGSYRLNVTVPTDVRAGVHKALYKLVDENGDLKYANGNVAYFWYKFSVLEDVPSLTLVDVVTASKNTIFTFEATLLESLKDIYTVQISLGDNGGGYLEPQEMIANANRDSFALARNISEAGNRVYKVAIFKDDIRVSDWVEGSYVVSTITDIPTNLTATQNTSGVTLNWDAVTDVESYVLMRSLNGILFGTYDEITGITTNGYFFDASHFSDGEILYFSVGVTGGEQSEKVSIIWEPRTGVSQVKKTGQTQSYDTSGTEVTDNSLKDDGFYQKGITPNYTRDDANDIVTDHITGLQWQDDSSVSTVRKQWLTDDNYATCTNDTSSVACINTEGDTAATYCTNLTLGGYSDWRLPTSTELEGIVDYGEVGPSIDTIYFNNFSSSYYWSSTAYEGLKGNAWFVDFNYGGVGYYGKDLSYYVRCVRDGQ